MTTGKTIALTRWNIAGKVMSLLFNTLSRLVITFLPRSKRLLISWLQSPSAVILETTALSNSMKLSHACGATQEGWVMVESSDKTWSTGEGNGKPLQYSCLTPRTVWKGKKIGHWKMNFSGRQVPNMLLEISWEVTPGRMKRWSQSKNKPSCWCVWWKKQGLML